jgi:cytochrome c-type biogenesis protein
MSDVSLGIAFLAGVLSFLSPCVLPLVPGYISYISGASLEELRQGSTHSKVVKKAGITSIFFVAGFSTVFIILGASATLIGRLFTAHMDILMKIAGVIIVILGLYLTGVLKIKWFNYEKRLTIKKISPSFFGAFVIGFAFGFGWTPCVGPILAGILTIAAAQDTIMKGVLLLSIYSLGLGMPLIAAGFGVGLFMRFFEKYKRFIRWGEVVAGILLVAIGILIFFNKLSVLSAYVPSFFHEFSK